MLARKCRCVPCVEDKDIGFKELCVPQRISARSFSEGNVRFHANVLRLPNGNYGKTFHGCFCRNISHLTDILTRLAVLPSTINITSTSPRPTKLRGIKRLA